MSSIFNYCRVTYRDIESGYFLLFFCLVISACESEHKKHQIEQQKTVRTSSRDVESATDSKSITFPRTLAEDIEAANRDPLIKQRKAAFLLDLKEDPGNEVDPESPGNPLDRVEANELMVLYARRYPLAGIEYIFTFDHPKYSSHNHLIDFVMELQEERPSVAMKLLKSIESPKRSSKFADALAWHIRIEEVDEMWEFLLSPNNVFAKSSDMDAIKRSLIGAEARKNPDSAWERFVTYFPKSSDEREFVKIPWGRMDATMPYPVHFLDRIFDKGFDVQEVLPTVVWKCTSAENIAPIEAWILEKRDQIDFKAACKTMTSWHESNTRDGNFDSARLWRSFSE
jgi:hypothetical protein